jgi:hypothetical protein
MTVPTERRIDSVRRIRACELHGIAPDSVPGERRRSVLAQLDQVDYEAPVAWKDSVEIFFGSESPEARGGINPYKLHNKMLRQRELKHKSAGARTDESDVPVSNPLETERRDAQPSEPDISKPREGSVP